MDWILYWKMYWIMLYACWLGWAGWLLLLSFPFTSFHFISFHFIPYLLSCPFRRWNGSVLEYEPVGKEIRERIKEEGGRWGGDKIIVKKRAPKKLDHFIYYPPWLVTMGNEPTFFGVLLLITYPHYDLYTLNGNVVWIFKNCSGIGKRHPKHQKHQKLWLATGRSQIMFRN